MRFPVIPSIFLLLLFISSAVILPNAVTLLPEKSTVAARLSAQSGLEVEFDGDMRLRFLPRPQLVLHHVRVTVDALQADDMGVRNLTAQTLVVSLSPLDFLQGQINVQGVDVLQADISLVLRDRLGGVMDNLLAVTHRGIRFFDTTLRLTGLDRVNREREVVLRNLSADFPARAPDEDLIVDLRQTRAGKADIRFRSRLGNIGGRRQDLSTLLSFAANEQVAFEGFVLQSPGGWRADGEMRLDSNALVSQLAQRYLPIELATTAQRIAFSGLVQLDRNGVRSENLEITALDTVFQSRLALAWPQRADEKPRLTGRLSTGVVNLDHIAIVDRDMQRLAPIASDLSAIWQAFEQDISIGLGVEATRFDIGGESGQNLVLALDWQDGLMDVQRFSLDLPFRSLVLANGVVDLRAPRPTFEGSFSTRSTDTLAAVLWLSELAGIDSSRLIETLDESRLQRVSLVGDIKWSANALHLQAMSGRLGDDRLSGDMRFALMDTLRGDISLQMERFDLADWGAVNAPASRAQDIFGALFQPLNRSLQTLLSNADENRNLRLDIAAQTLFSGVNNLGPVRFVAQINDRRLNLQELALPAFNDTAINVTGQMNFDAASPHGRISAIIRGEGALPRVLGGIFPFTPVEAGALDLRADWYLSAPDAPDWPNTRLTGEGSIGGIETAFTLSGPARIVSFNTAGQKLDVSMLASAAEIAGLVNLAAPYDDEAAGAFRLSLENQSRDVAQISANMDLGTDNLSLSGLLRRTPIGQRVEGALSFRLADVLPLLFLDSGNIPLAAEGAVQITSTPENFAFAGLDTRIGAGRMTGEGVVDLTPDVPKLNANIKADNLDMEWLLPTYEDASWSQAPMQWAAFARADVDVELAGKAIRLGALTLDEVAARIKLLDGVLETPQITGRALDGAFEASLLAEGGSLTPNFNLDLKIKDMVPTPLFAALFDAVPLSTRLGGTVKLSGRGTSVRNMMASLDGAMQFDLGAGLLNFVDLARFADRVSAADFEGAAAPLLEADNAAIGTDFMRAVGLVDIQNGQAVQATMDFVFPTEAARRDGRFDGQLDFVSREVLATLTLYPTNAADKLVWQLSGDMRDLKTRLDARDFDRLPPPATSSGDAVSASVPTQE